MNVEVWELGNEGMKYGNDNEGIRNPIALYHPFFTKGFPLAVIKKNSSIDMEELFLTLKTTNMKIFVVVYIT
jgi:hypothetical protein